jgi:hypothetical protein
MGSCLAGSIVFGSRTGAGVEPPGGRGRGFQLGVSSRQANALASERVWCRLVTKIKLAVGAACRSAINIREGFDETEHTPHSPAER